MEIFCGIDWAERHHDVALVDESGRQLARRRIGDDVAGFTELTTLLAEHGGGQRAKPVDIAIETDRGLLVAALRAAGHRIYAINPKSVDRYRDRHTTSRAKSDSGDALVLAHLLRTDRHAHRPLAQDSELAQAVRVLARAHQDTVWARQQDANRLRSLLREYFPAALAAFPDLTSRTALVVLAAAPTPAAAAALSQAELIGLMQAAGRGTRPGEAARLAELFARDQLHQLPLVEQAMGRAATSIVRAVTAANQSLHDLETGLAEAFEQHPDAEILRGLPGLGLILAARVLAEFGDDPTRWPDPASRRAYAGTAPITRASGRSHVVLARFIRNKRLSDACYLWAYTVLTKSAGARSYYDARRAAGDTHDAALRRLGSKLLGQLHHCLATAQDYDETTAWPPPQPIQSAA